jgi:lincosamide and streptogramin A transport system ATP-binding/permease protein
MSTIVIDRASFHYDAPYVQVFENLTLSIDTAWKTGVVGRNGRGKTTLLHLLTGELEPATGVVSVPVPTSYFPYQPVDPHHPTAEVVKSCVAPFADWEARMRTAAECGDAASVAEYGRILERYESLGGYDIDARIERELVDIGMSPEVAGRRFDTLSPGEQTRALIVALFLRRGSLPLIDEPTNHLDMAGRMCLGDYLAEQEGFMLVSHDRHFLDQCVDHVLSLGPGEVRIAQGDFSQWKYNMELENEHQRRRQAKLGREIRALERASRQRRTWSHRKEKEKIGAGDKGFISHRAAKQMKRALAIERRIRAMIEEKKSLLKNVEKERILKLETEGKAPEIVLSIANLSVAVEGRPLIDDFSVDLHRGDRTALIGPNGCGKTTLLRAAAGELSAGAASPFRLTGGHTHLPRYLSVSRAYQIPRWGHGLLREHLRRAGIGETDFRNIMAAFGVSGEIFDRPLETFSQGERKKVDLCRSFLGASHLLIWDEPMNYVDLQSREQVEEVILEHRPTMLFVEHDRWFIEKVATRIVEMK